MAEVFDEIKFEVYLSSSDGWVDISPDVCIDPPPRWNRGIMGNKVNDRVGSPGYLTFDLDNSAANSGGVVGYYTPGHVNSRLFWAVGLPVRLSFLYENQRFYKFYGHILGDGIKIDPGNPGPLRVHVRVGDFMDIAARHEIKGLVTETNKRIEEAVATVVNNMTVAPLDTDYQTGIYTFPTVFDNVRTGTTTAASEFQKLANSEMAHIYVIGDCSGGEKLIVENRDYRESLSPFYVSRPSSDSGFLKMEDGFYLLLETGDKIVLNEKTVTSDTVWDERYFSEGTEIGYGNQIINRIRITTYPRRVDAAATTTLFTHQRKITHINPDR